MRVATGESFVENEKPSPQSSKNSTQLLTEIMVTFGDRPDPNSNEGRFPLRGCRGTVNSPSQANKTFEVDVVDLSFRGAGFVTDNCMEIGEVINFAFQSLPNSQNLWPAKIVRTQPRDDGRYHIGIQFLR